MLPHKRCMAGLDDKVVPIRRPRNPGPKPRRWTRARDYGTHARPWSKQVTPIMVALPLAAFTAVFLWGGPPLTLGVETPASGADRDSAHFTMCGSGARVNCVVDGDTFWYRGKKIRVADINTPEVSKPECAIEARLGAQATGRMHELLNAGPFTLERIERDRDRYDRLLRIVTRGGESLGTVLVAEGLADEWQGRRGSWC